MSYYNGKKVISLIVTNGAGVAKKTYSESVKSGDQPIPPTPQLEAPTISLNGDILAISSVPNATSYDIYVDNTLETNISATTLDLTTLSLTTGTYSIKVKAKATNYLDSEFSNSVNYVVSPQLNTPVISLSNDTLSISEVENAEYYDIYVDGVLKESVSPTPTPSGGIVVLTLTNEDELRYKDYFRVYDGQDNTGTLLFESTGQVATPSPQTLNCQSGYLYFELSGGLVAIFGGITTTGDIEFVSGENDSEFVYSVNSNGTINIDELHWDD